MFFVCLCVVFKHNKAASSPPCTADVIHISSLGTRRGDVTLDVACVVKGLITVIGTEAMLLMALSNPVFYQVENLHIVLFRWHLKPEQTSFLGEGGGLVLGTQDKPLDCPYWFPWYPPLRRPPLPPPPLRCQPPFC
jgi:hypothetical protein